MKVAGADEAGRGPLVGSVVAAAVILDPNNPIDGLNDSKKLTEKKREKLFVEIKEKALGNDSFCANFNLFYQDGFRKNTRLVLL